MMDFTSEQFYQQDFSAERIMLNSIRANLIDAGQDIVVPEKLTFQFDPEISNVYITLFQEKIKSIRWGSRKKDLPGTLQRITRKLRDHKKFDKFAIADPGRCRIMFEIVTHEYPCDPKKLTILELNDNRLEPGIHGLKFHYKGNLYYYMPTEAVTNSLMTVNQVFNYLSKRTGLAKKIDRISVRTRKLRARIENCKLIKSFACISYNDQVLPLYRGYPVPVELTMDTLRERVAQSTDWILENMRPNGQFLYYYDGIKDTDVDFQHPGMKNPTYYNILRHAGGTITLLRAYESAKDPKYLEGAKKSLDFILTVFREHEYQGQYACYPFFNKKSKLGGAGIGLVSFLQYYRLSGDDQYRKYIDGLVYHILSRVSETGELIGYFIHPSFNDGKEIIDPDEETKKELFSFYYPGEALLGLVLYLRHIPDINPELRELILEKGKMALDFLVRERPRKYHYLFEPLPADGWLMQAIEEWVKIDGFADQSYIDFVYNDTQAMIDHMYLEHNAPYFDYIGSFYYHYGEHAYPDGARCEGIMAAYYLARHLGHDHQAEYLLTYIIKAARNLLYTFNTRQSCYAHKYPEKSINSFRFKLTRQWVRVDSVQHTACFYARLLPVLSDRTISDALKKKHAPQERIDGFTLLEKIEAGGFATVYLAENPADGSKKYALKQLHKSKYNFNRIVREIHALKTMSNYPGAVRCHRAKAHLGEMYFLFDFAEGGDLRTCVRKNGKFTEKQIIDLLRDILDEILFAREQNLLHLDISIFNVIRLNNKFSLIDWGLSNSGPEVVTTVIKGHRTYLAPDIYYGKRTFASEIYSLGATLYFAATGKVIFNIHTRKTPIEQKMFKHFYFKPDFPRDTPEKVRYLLLRMLEKKPENRATVEEIRSIIRDDFVVPEYSYPWNREDEKYDLSDTFLLYKKMAEDGVGHAQWMMGRYCENGEFVPQSFALAGYWYTRAAALNYLPALCSLALLHLENKETSRDYAKALSLLEQAASGGHGEAQFHLARMFENGWGVQQDREKSTYWYTESAKNGYGKAIAKLDELGVDLFRDFAGSHAFEFNAPPAEKKNNPAGKVLIPLGDDCQLGAALELYGYKETSLFKWAKISPGQLADALNNDFREIYDSGLADFYLRPPNGRIGILGENKNIPLPRNGGWAPHREYMEILDDFDPEQEFHTAIIDRERGFTHGILVTRADLLQLSKDEIRKRNQEKITYLKNKTRHLIREEKGEITFLRAQRNLSREAITDLNRAFLALKTLRGAKPFIFLVATPDKKFYELRDFFDRDIRVVFFDMFSPPDNPMLLRHSYPEWKKLFGEYGVPVQGKFKKSILFSGFDTCDESR